MKKTIDGYSETATGPVDRREFLLAAAGVGFALAAQPIMAQTVIKTDTTGLTAGFVPIPVADGSMMAYRAQPAGGANFPVILVISEVFGVHEWVTDICRRLAKLGYLAVAPNLFARHGDPLKEPDLNKLISNIINKTPDAEVMSDLDATVAWAKAGGADVSRLGITGFCWGGRITWLYAAHNPKVKAGVAFYGRIEYEVNAVTPSHPIDIAATLKTPVLGLYGGLDKMITADHIAAMQAALAKGHSKSEIHVYPDAEHGFMADYRPSYNKEAAEDGWKRMQAWFKQNGV